MSVKSCQKIGEGGPARKLRVADCPGAPESGAASLDASDSSSNCNGTDDRKPKLRIHPSCMYWDQGQHPSDTPLNEKVGLSGRKCEEKLHFSGDFKYK